MQEQSVKIEELAEISRNRSLIVVSLNIRILTQIHRNRSNVILIKQ
jgi:hypothetical protein